MQAPSLLVEIEIRVAAVRPAAAAGLHEPDLARRAHPAVDPHRRAVLRALPGAAIAAARPVRRRCVPRRRRAPSLLRATCRRRSLLRTSFDGSSAAGAGPGARRRHRRGIVGISVLLGYLAVGASSTNAGYGDFAADLAFLVNAQGSSKLMPDLPYAPATWEGIGFRRNSVCSSCWSPRSSRFSSRRSTPTPFDASGHDRAGVRDPGPVRRLADDSTSPGRTLVDLTGSPLSLDFVGNIYRTNGRFVWSLTWLVALGAFAVVARRSLVPPRDFCRCSLLLLRPAARRQPAVQVRRSR